MVKTTYLETDADVDGFLDVLKNQLHDAIAKGERQVEVQAIGSGRESDGCECRVSSWSSGLVLAEEHEQSAS